jgi:hypothetical protein
MKFRQVGRLGKQMGWVAVAGISCVTVAAIPSASQAATFPGISFECPVGGRVLFARRTPVNNPVKNFSAPIVQFSSMGRFTANQRCQEVAARFNYLNNNPGKNSLAYLTTGIRRGMPIVCSVQNYGDSCDQANAVQLLTLLPKDRSPERRDQALMQLLIKLNNPLSQTPVLLDNQPRLYINLDEMIKQAFDQEEHDQLETTDLSLPQE